MCQVTQCGFRNAGNIVYDHPVTLISLINFYMSSIKPYTKFRNFSSFEGINNNT